ncbi:cell division protein ZapD [Candidatus Saccharibacteria bacterium]|nr:cell division protein ZapD [Candidatus Saccharibacteria bacterium]
MDNSILFEEPATENMRFCLRLEHLQQQVRLTHMGTSSTDSYHCVLAIIELLKLLERHDLRTKLSQELVRLLTACKRLQSMSDVDSLKLMQLIEQLEHLCSNIHNNKGMFAQDLRENEFIQCIYRSHAIPGGMCRHHLPGFYLWLTEISDKSHSDIKTWLKSFDEIFSIVSVILRFTRECSNTQRHIAYSGFFQMALDAQLPCQLIRVRYPRDFDVFPKISIGRHGLGIRFLSPNLNGRAQQSLGNIAFELAICYSLVTTNCRDIA